MTTVSERAPLQRDGLGLPGEFVAPEGEVESRLAAMWCDALNFDRIGRDDDFFDLGGDSLAAMTLSAAVGEAFGVDFKPSQIMENNTIRRMALEIGSSRGRRLPRNIVLARSSEGRPPLFMIHGQYGITFLPPQFMRGFHDDQPVYIFQVPGFDGASEPYDNVERIASDYLSTMLEVQPDGPYFIAAFCAGSWIAIEMANQMRRRGLSPDRLILMDPALHAAMDDEFLVNRGRISGGNIFLLSPLAARAKLAASDLFRRTKFLHRTGHWVNGQDHASFAIPAVQRFWVERQSRSLDPDQVRSVATGKWFRRAESPETQPDSSGTPSSMLQAAAYASAKLQLAFRTYRPEKVDGVVDLIVSEDTARSLEHPAHPINRVMPDRRLVVFGKTHAETIAGADSRNARLIQEMLDETSARLGG